MVIRIKQFTKVAATGGPCGGKTLLLRHAREKMPGYGALPLPISEVATDFLKSGIMPGFGGLTNAQFQELVLKEQRRREDFYEHVALRLNVPRVFGLCDRGMPDSRAYCPREVFEMILEKYGLDIEKIMARYKGVVHMVTAANGAVEHYTLLNNEARTETPEQAIQLDEKLIQAWSGHPRLRIIDNSTDIEGKLRRALAALCRLIGIPAPIEDERKFLVKEPSISNFPVHAVKINIEQAYLVSENPETERRVRKRSQGGSSTYTQTDKIPIRPGMCAEPEFQIGPMPYLHALAYERDPSFAIIQKRRFCFPYASQYFELDCFASPHPGLWILEIELTEERQEVKIPPFI
ncbi:MAG: AAA family ATPase [Parcubacteria group bacterium]|nr:AAA family ATPase [Parcubacteria group bacterium]